ncbi:ABC transporter permease [Bacillus sp. V3B]|uniref:ABC transporter permease n=1 Tax=Bacillus sp. V3B TaxID=2804915 RepID=UPI00210A69EB|nr:ABC-2 transporter permease [Bacillus sp. V3B]MCQ6276880.1 ABC transporter permease [Bacillus sp. V3B]
MYARLFKGTGHLTYLMFRQERFRILIWLIGLIAVTLAAASAYPGIYPDEPSRLAFALTMENPAMIAMIGPVYPAVYYTIGVIFANEMLLFTAITVAIMNILLVGRSTRADEEEGRTEVIRSLPVGRLSYMSASMFVMFLINILLALFIGIGLGALRVDGINFEGSILYGSILGATGLIFTAFTAFFAQLSETSRGATTLSFATLIVAYIIRAIGDVSNETLSLLSPLGWIVRTEVFAGDDWWPIFLTVAVAIVMLVAAFYLNAIRDVGSGFIPERKGKKYASSFLQTPLGLILRLQRTHIIAWSIGLFLMSASFGSVLGDLETYFADNEFVQAFLAEDPAYSMTEQFITLLMAIMALLSTIPAVMLVLKLKGEENKNRTEHFYSRAVSRTRILGSYSLLAIVLSFVMQSFVAVGLWSVGSTMMDGVLTFDSIYTSALVYLPAMWIVIGFAVLFVGVVPKATGLVWFYVIYCFIVVYLSGILDFPEWMNNLSVFEHIPQIPIEDMSFVSMILLVFISIVLTIIGFIGYNKRDLAG